MIILFLIGMRMRIKIKSKITIKKAREHNRAACLPASIRSQRSLVIGCKTHKRPEKLERATGIEPAWPVWKTGTLPLSYARNAFHSSGDARVVNWPQAREARVV